MIKQIDPAFATSGSVVLFASDTTKESLEKWVNNQHSCGLFPDVPKPVSTTLLPEDGISVIAKVRTGVAENPMDQATYNDYKVKLEVKALTVAEKFTLEAFELESSVHSRF